MIEKHSITLFGHNTSFTLESEFWDELKSIATKRGTSLSALIEEIDSKREGNLSSALRVFVLNTIRSENKKTLTGF